MLAQVRMITVVRAHVFLHVVADKLFVAHVAFDFLRVDLLVLPQAAFGGQDLHAVQTLIAIRILQMHFHVLIKFSFRFVLPLTHLTLKEVLLLVLLQLGVRREIDPAVGALESAGVLANVSSQTLGPLEHLTTRSTLIVLGLYVDVLMGREMGDIIEEFFTVFTLIHLHLNYVGVTQEALLKRLNVRVCFATLSSDLPLVFQHSIVLLLLYHLFNYTGALLTWDRSRDVTSWMSTTDVLVHDLLLGV